MALQANQFQIIGGVISNSEQSFNVGCIARVFGLAVVIELTLGQGIAKGERCLHRFYTGHVSSLIEIQQSPLLYPLFYQKACPKRAFC
jgi:hypothetical protein